MQPAPPSAPNPGHRQQSTAAAHAPSTTSDRPASQEGGADADAAAAGGEHRPAPPPSGTTPVKPAPPSSSTSAAAAPPPGGAPPPATGRRHEAPASPAAATGAASSSRLAAGNALALARQANDVQQDVDLYQRVAVELGDVPALQSLLFTHRNSTTDDGSCDDDLARVTESVERWASARRDRAASETAVQKDALSAEASEMAEVTRQREREIEAVLTRMQEAFDHVDDLEKVRAEQSETSVRRDAERAKARREQEQANVKEYCDALDQFEVERRARVLAIDHADQRGKVEVTETLQRGLIVTSEVNERVGIARVAADDRELARLFEEAIAARRGSADVEAVEAAHLQTWADHLATRCGHQTTVMKLREEHRQHVMQAEISGRELCELEETRAFEALYVTALEHGVKSQARRQLLDETVGQAIQRAAADEGVSSAAGASTKQTEE